MQFFDDLGSLIEQRWRGRNYEEGVFPEIAARTLREADPGANVDVWEILRWVNTAPSLPDQHDVAGNFGDPPITLYNGPRFYIDLYFWLDGTTAIHEHSFCGAFQVILGSSILGEYTFSRRRQINAHLAVGDIGLKQIELLNRGDVREIHPGSRYIHSLFHLDRPSVSLIARTYQSPGNLPQ